MTAAVEHEFGSQHTEIKLSVVEGYLKAFTTSLRPHFKRLLYFDAFAGTGARTERVAARDQDLIGEAVPEQVSHRRGSARIALEIEPKFDRFFFMEQNPKHCAALEQMKQEFPDRSIEILPGDANELIVRLIENKNWAGTRGVMFLDPYGMQVDWETLEAIRRTEAIDVWYLFSLSGLYRQAARNLSAVDVNKRTAISRMLGTHDWESELYHVAPQGDLLASLEDPVERQRNADVSGLENYVKRRLMDLFPYVHAPLALPVWNKPQRFSLFFATSNPSPKATALAGKFASHLLNKERRNSPRGI